MPFRKLRSLIFVRKAHSPSDILVSAPKTPEITEKFNRRSPSAILWEKFLGLLSTIYILLLFIAAEWIQFAYLLYEKKDAPKEASSCLDMIKYGISECKGTTAGKAPDTDLRRALHQEQIPLL